MKNTQQLPCLIADTMHSNSWEEWLEKTETALRELGYVKYTQNIKNEDFAYWKSFYVNDNRAYQIGLFFYDFREYPNMSTINIQFECMLIDINARIDLSVSKDISLEQFETMTRTFYDTMYQFV